jgi:hypothetical protein
MCFHLRQMKKKITFIFNNKNPGDFNCNFKKHHVTALEVKASSERQEFFISKMWHCLKVSSV